MTRISDPSGDRTTLPPQGQQQDPDWLLVDGDPVPRSLRDWLWPQRNPRYWFVVKDGGERRELRREEIRSLLSGALVPEETLEQVRDVAQSAAGRPAAAERRAATLSGAVAIAASLTVGGAGLVLDRSKVPDQAWRVGFAVAFALATLMFVFSGLYATRALVTFRKWGMPHPYRVVTRRRQDVDEQRLARAAEMLDNFTFSWEISDAKLRAVDSSFRAFTVALLLLVVIAMGFAVYQEYETTPPPARQAISLPKRHRQSLRSVEAVAQPHRRLTPSASG